MGTAEMTKRVLKGLSHKKAKILAHPTGRLLNSRTGYNMEWKEIFSFCKSERKAIEINSWPYRLDLPDSLVRQAVEMGVTLVIDSDSHATEHMDIMRFGVYVARRGWAEPKNILNTWTEEKLADFLLKS
jgi:DNA polymerase (family 10)